LLCCCFPRIEFRAKNRGDPRQKNGSERVIEQTFVYCQVMGYEEVVDMSEILIENNILTCPRFAIRGELHFESIIVQSCKDGIGRD